MSSKYRSRVNQLTVICGIYGVTTASSVLDVSQRLQTDVGRQGIVTKACSTRKKAMQDDSKAR